VINTPFLPGIPTQLYGRQKRSQLEKLRGCFQQTLQNSITDYGVLFDDIVPIHLLHEASSEERTRTYPEIVTFWAWASQILECNSSCAKAVATVQNWYAEANKSKTPAQELKIPSNNSASYCDARNRLSTKFLDAVCSQVESYTEARIDDSDLWYGFRLKAIDGTSFQLMDTSKNQAKYPQPKTQKAGCGTPVMGFLGILDLAKGSIASYKLGKHTDHDLKVAQEMCDDLNRDDLLLADRAFCSYGFISLLLAKGVHSVMRLHQARHKALNWSKGKYIDQNSRLVTWKKGSRPSKSPMTQEQWDSFPEELSIRYIRTTGRSRDGKPRKLYIATTLTDAELYDTGEIALLYAERWKIEVKFRDIKTTLKLEQLRVKTPEMAEKMIKLIQIVYNLVKAIQLEAIGDENLVMDELSFKGTLDVISEFRGSFKNLQSKPKLRMAAMENIEQRIAERVLLIRPNRSEPRAIKRRPKNYQLLTKPRGEFIENQHRSRYKKVA
jgi:Transposase DDE domain